MKLHGRAALVTGAARGIGLAIASRFVTEGARVALIDIDESVEGAAKRLGEGALGLVADVKANAPLVPYSTAKAGVIGFTKGLAKEVATRGILVNAVAPAMIGTDMVRQMSQETVDMLLAKVPMGRVGRPEEVAALVTWLASDECSFSTGAVYDLSGGRATY